MLYAIHANAVNRHHRGVMSRVCVGHAVRCAFVAPELRTRRLLGTCATKNNSTQNTRVSMLQVSSRQRNTAPLCHQCCIRTLLKLRRISFLTITAPSRWRGLAIRAMPLMRNSNSLVWWCEPPAMRACLPLDDALRRYVRYR